MVLSFCCCAFSVLLFAWWALPDALPEVWHLGRLFAFDGYSMHMASVTVIVVERVMKHAAIVPHGKGALPPLKPLS